MWRTSEDIWGRFIRWTDPKNSFGGNYKGCLNLKVAGSKYFEARTVTRQSPVLYTVMLRILIIFTTIPFSSSLIVLSPIPLIVFLFMSIHSHPLYCALFLSTYGEHLHVSRRLCRCSCIEVVGFQFFLSPQQVYHIEVPLLVFDLPCG